MSLGNILKLSMFSNHLETVAILVDALSGVFHFGATRNLTCYWICLLILLIILVILLYSSQLLCETSKFAEQS